MNEWRFLFDENVDPKTVPYLRKEGVHAEHVRDSLWLGADDREHVIPYAREHDLVVVTSDVGGLRRSRTRRARGRPPLRRHDAGVPSGVRAPDDDRYVPESRRVHRT